MKPTVYMSGTLVDEVRQTKTPGGRLVTNTKIEFVDDQGNTQRAPIKAWEGMAKALGKLSVGDKVDLICTLEQERWKNKKTNENHSRLCLVAEEFDDEVDEE